MDSIEGNKIIAEFMGAIYYQEDENYNHDTRTDKIKNKGVYAE